MLYFYKSIAKELLPAAAKFYYLLLIYMVDLCKYKYTLGVPRKGIHSYRLFDVAIADVIMTIIGSFIISYLFKLPFLYVTLFIFILGIFLHRIFCVRTTIDKLLFP